MAKPFISAPTTATPTPLWVGSMPSNWMPTVIQSRGGRHLFPRGHPSHRRCCQKWYHLRRLGDQPVRLRPRQIDQAWVPLQYRGTCDEPTIGGDGTISIVANVAPKFGYLYAIRPDGSLKPDSTFDPRLIVSGGCGALRNCACYVCRQFRVYVAAREGSTTLFRATNGSVIGSANQVVSSTHR